MSKIEALSKNVAMSSSAPKHSSHKLVVREVDLSEYRPAGQCLAEAFEDDEVARYGIDTPETDHWPTERKWKVHLWLMEYLTYAHSLSGLTTTIGDNYDCVALWMPPGCHFGHMTVLRSGIWKMLFYLSWEGLGRLFLEFFPLLERTKAEVMRERDDDSYYLVYIGTKQSARGQGLARRLIADMTARADREGKACYLESSNIRNLRLYESLGFETKRRISLTRGAKEVLLDIMVREPQTKRG